MRTVVGGEYPLTTTSRILQRRHRYAGCYARGWRLGGDDKPPLRDQREVLPAMLPGEINSRLKTRSPLWTVCVHTRLTLPWLLRIPTATTFTNTEEGWVG